MNELIEQLMQTAGVNQEQAEGGAGLLFKLAKAKLGSSDFATLKDGVPGVGKLLLQQQPDDQPAGVMGWAQGLLSRFGGGSLGGAVELARGFSQLGLDPQMIATFIPVVIQFVRQKGGEEIAAQLEKILKPA